MASARFVESTLTPAQSLDEAWAGLQQPDTWATIAGISEVTNPSFDSGGNLTDFLFTAVVAGKDYAGKADVRLSSRPTDMVVGISTSEIVGQIATHLTPGAAGVSVEVTLDLQSRGILSMMMFPIISSAVQSGLADQVADLAQHLAAARQ